MSTRTADDILREAIARNIPAVVSLPYLGTLRHYKSRLLAERDGLIIEMVSAEKTLINDLVASKQPVGVSFKTATEKVILAAPIHRVYPVFRLSEHVRVEALQLVWPSDIQIIQRRADYRAKVTDESKISVRVSKIAAEQALKYSPLPSEELRAKPIDLSASGIGVQLTSPTGQALGVTPDDRLRIEIRAGDQILFVEGQLRHPEAGLKEPTGKAGIKFIPQDTLESRQTMSKIARLSSDLQRAELRRTRRGILGAA
jgi:c-di-GMP-binding flagellar brake protein YcgR